MKETRMNRPFDFLPILADQFGSKRLRRIADLFLAIPLAVTAIVTSLYLLLWHKDPLAHFIHMLWVLGFWMAGTLAMFAFIIPLRLKLGKPFRVLILSAVAIALAIYFTPLSRFLNIFPMREDLILPAVFGVLNLTICWSVVLRFRNKIVETSTR